MRVEVLVMVVIRWTICLGDTVTEDGVNDKVTTVLKKKKKIKSVGGNPDNWQVYVPCDFFLWGYTFGC